MATTTLPREFIREVSDRVSIVEVISRHVQLKRDGSRWKGLCPFHDEKTPSFNVSNDRGTYYCFGCHESGDAIDFLRKLEGLSFVDAVKDLAGRAGLAVPEKELSPAELAASRHRQRLLEANEHACAFFEQVLARSDAGAVARTYLAGRGYDREFAKTWRIGAAPDSWDMLRDHLRRQGVTDAEAIEAGLLVAGNRGSPFDFFRNRLMFPILGPGKKVIAFGGRALGDDKAKYVNTPETPVYSKSVALYGLYEGRRAIHAEDKALVVEGYFDVLALARAGMGFGVAPCGTALTDRQLAAIRNQTRNVVMMFDSDAAGRRAGVRALELCLQQGLWPMRLEVPDGKDPDEFLQVHGPEALRELLETPQALMAWYIDELAQEIHQNQTSREAVLELLAPLLAQLDLAKRSRFARDLEGLLGLDDRPIQQAIKAAGRKLATAPRRTKVDLHPSRQTAAPAPIPSPRRAAPAPRRAPSRPGPPSDGPPEPFDDDGYYDALPPEGPSPEVPFPGFPDDEPGLGDVPPDQPAPEPRRATSPGPNPPELQLLRLLAQDLEEVGPLIDDYGVLGWLDQEDVAIVVERFLDAWEAGRSPSGAELLSGVSNTAIRSAIASILASDEQHLPRAVLERAEQECVLRLRMDWVARRYSAVKGELDALQRRGTKDRARMLPLVQECYELEVEREKLEQHLRGSV